MAGSFFYLLLRRPPTTPLFPYTTLFRSLRELSRPQDVDDQPFLVGAELNCRNGNQRPAHETPNLPSARQEQGGQRSEEHTSELQSHVNLVCRLLLEKKKRRAPGQETHRH